MKVGLQRKWIGACRVIRKPQAGDAETVMPHADTEYHLVDYRERCRIGAWPGYLAE